MKKMFAMMAVVGAGSDTGNAWMMKPRPKGFLEGLTIPEATKQIMHAAQPTFLNITVNRIREEIKINNKEDLEGLVKTIFEMAENDSVDTDQETNNPHARMGETYADILFSLSPDMPTFEMEGEKTITFTRILLNAIQNSFESLMGKFAEAEKAGTATDPTTVNRLISVVSFIGHLHVRKLMPTSLMAHVVDDLIGLTRYNNIFVVEDRHPDPTLIRCVCELMQIIGKFADGNEKGNILITQFLARLSQLAYSKRDNTVELYTQDIRDGVKAVHAARFDNWPARAGTQVLVQYEELTYAQAPEGETTDQSVPKKVFLDGGQLPEVIPRPNGTPLKVLLPGLALP